MNVLYIGSTQPYAGKTLLVVALGRLFAQRGVRVGHFRPFGTLPEKRDGAVVDEDTAFVREALGLGDPVGDLCPVVLTPDLVRRALEPNAPSLLGEVTAAYQRVCKGKDLMLVGGTGSILSAGYLFGLESPRLLPALDARALLIIRYEDER